MNFQSANILNPSGSAIDLQGESLVIQTGTGSMWGKGQTCSDIILFPHKLKTVSVQVSLQFLPQLSGEQAGIVLFVDSDNYVKLVREMVDGKQVVVLAKEFAGEPSPELISPFESSATKLQLQIRTESITVCWNADEDTDPKESIFPNWFAGGTEFHVGLLVHGSNPNNEATFHSFSINEQPNSPLHGVTLERVVTGLVDHYGWDELGDIVGINCFRNDPSVKSSLKFLRKTPWARDKVEDLYISTFAR